MTISAEGGVVLVVDDNEMNVDLLVSALERHGYVAIGAQRGSVALKIAEEQLPELILLDITMPEMNGYDVCKALKANPITADIPVVFISALDETSAVIQGFDVGAVDYVTKPFKFREVLARVSTHIMMLRQKRQLDAKMVREVQQYQMLDSMRQQFIGSATHDMKNPLFIISGYTDMLEIFPEVYENQDAMGCISAIKRGVDKMNGLVHDLLDLLQLESDVTIQREQVRYRAFLHHVIADQRLRAEAKNLQFEFIMPESDPTLFVDVRRLTRVMDNLISNAIKYTPEGGTIMVAGWTVDNWAVIEVRDTGLGIPDEFLPTLFQPFKRVTTEEHMAQEGTGLGLSIVKTLVDQHNGKIEVESVLGKGSTFRVMIPV